MSNNITFENYCCICDKSFKTKSNLNRHFLTKKHTSKTIESKTIESKTSESTRNHENCQKTEISVTKFFEKNIEKIIELNGRRGKILNILKKTGKNDTRFLFEDVETKKVSVIGVQTKQDNATFVENWINVDKLIIKINKQNTYTEDEKKDAIDIVYQLENIIKNNIDIYKNFLKKYKNRHGKENTEFVKQGVETPLFDKSVGFVKFGMCVSLTEKKNIHIKSKLLKMLFITGGIDNTSDEFYYTSLNKNELFEIKNLKKVDDDFIENTNLYFHPRMIYTSSGKTQLKHYDFFAYKGNMNGKTFNGNFKDLINNTN
jgi:hypothetical protein